MRRLSQHVAILAAAFLTLSPQAHAAPSVEAAGPNTPLSFPREFNADGARIIVHVLQIDTWDDFAKVEGRFAVEITPNGEADAVLGTVEFVADTDANIEQRMVAVDNIEITATSFPISDEQRRIQLDGLVRGVIKQRTQFVPMDVVLSYIAPEAKLPEEKGLSFQAPPIFYSSSPAILVMTDGEPVLAPVAETRLQYAVNTNWDLFRYKDKQWYLRHDQRWLRARTLDGTWKYDSSLPRDFKKLPDDGNWTDVKAANPPAKGGKTVPTVFVSDRPAELIVTDGEPSFSIITAGGLGYVNDTESELFRLNNEFFYLVSGRWFTATALRGPWTHVTELPADFANIPADSEKAHVLAAVSGTQEARLAVLEASIPRKATVSRNAGDAVVVLFQGDPIFVPITDTQVERAVNSSSDILLFDGTHYLCQEAVWYTSGAATGPWIVADSIPAAIYSIPASSESYHVTHVHVYESDDDTVSTGYTSGYFGVYVGFGVAMYGSGWYYPPYYGYGSFYGYPHYPYYYPYPYSYGASAWYNPNTGMYGRSGSVYGPYGGYGRGASYNPQTGTYARGAAVWDSNEIAGSGFAYNPRTGTGVATNRYASEHGGWGESLVTHNDKWIQTRSEWNDYSRNTEFRTSGGASGELTSRQVGNSVVRSGELQRGNQSLSTGSIRGPQGGAIGVVETGAGERAALGKTAEGDLFAGKDGQVYKRDSDGWYQRGDSGWEKAAVSEQRAAQARSSFEARDSSSLSERRPSANQAPSRTYDSNRNRSSFDSTRRSELNRTYNARTSGYQRYGNRSSTSRNRSSAGGMRRRR
jgi:hypothetical protein